MLRTYLLMALLVTAILTGCGGSGKKNGSANGSPSTSSSATTLTPARLAGQKPLIENAKVAARACRRGVTLRSAGLAGETKDELVAVCNKIGGVISKDLRVVDIVCGEVANAAPSARSAPARGRIRAACLAEGKRRD